MAVTVRFAPSPTGNIHIGNVRTALFNWLYALKHGGTFILRFDDTDTARSRTEYAEQIASDLAWLGVLPHRVEYQSMRTEAHDAAAATLKSDGLLYPCYETPEELERRRKIRLTRRLPPVYGREALRLTDEERATLEAEGRKPHWRFLLPNYETSPFETRRSEIHWDDVVRGPQTVDLASMSDPVLIREDGSYLYTLPSVVDDINMAVTHVIRGDDHVTNTGAQIALFAALGAEAPAFGHHNLLTTTTGEGLSKRSGALAIKALREADYEPMAVAALAVLIGTSENVTPSESLEAMSENFNPSSSSKSAAKFDPAELDILNRQIVHGLAFETVSDRLAAAGVDTSDPRVEAFWTVIKANVDKVSEAAGWWSIITHGPASDAILEDDDLAFARTAFSLLPDGDVDESTWGVWTTAVKQATGRKGRALFMPLRIALTGRSSGPEISDLLPLLGREEIVARQP